MTQTQALLLLKLLDVLGAGIQAAPAVIDRFHRSRDLVERLIREDRDPTEAEWAELDQEIASLRDALHGRT